MKKAIALATSQITSDEHDKCGKKTKRRRKINLKKRQVLLCLEGGKRIVLSFRSGWALNTWRKALEAHTGKPFPGSTLFVCLMF